MGVRAGSGGVTAVWDALVVGAGPAGTAAAYDLARAGRKVLILDRHHFPRKKACAGGITPKAISLFAFDISGLVLKTINQVDVRMPGGKVFRVQTPQPLCYMVQRQDLDMFALSQCLAAGARFQKLDRVLEITQDPGTRGVRVRFEAAGSIETCHARFVVGADGANSRVKRFLADSEKDLGWSLFPRSGCPALEADVRVANPWDFAMEFDFSKQIQGYYWIFPKHDHLNIGIYATRPRTPMTRGVLAAYARERTGTDQLTRVKGYPIGARWPGARPGKGQVLLVGDAAGLAEPLLGEGIYAALSSGRLAARAILTALGKGSPLALLTYHQLLARLRLDLKLFHGAAWLLYRFPKPCLSLAQYSLVHRPFAKGYAAGKTLSQILLPF